MTWWVWAVDENDAIERLWHCREYKTKAEALRKDPRDNSSLFEVRVEKS